MEKVTLTKLYEVLAQKVGRNEAECLTQYVEIKVKSELNSKTEILATKILVKDECLGLKGDIHSLRTEFYSLRDELREDIHSLRTEMKDNTISLQKWMLATFITLVTMIMGLYAIILIKH